MDRHLDKDMPPATSYRGTFRRHRRLFYAPVVLGAIVAAVFVFSTGKTYKSTTSLWIDTAASAPSSISANGGPLSEPPSAAEQAVLSELLSTRAFTASIAKSVLPRRAVPTPAAAQASAAALLGSGQLVETPSGSQVLQLTYTGSSPTLAKSVLTAAVKQLRHYTATLTARHNQATAAFDAQQVKVTRRAMRVARNNLAIYQAQHPGVGQTNSSYASLVAAETNAVTQLSQAKNALSQISSTGNSDIWSVQVIDPANPGSSIPVRKRKIAEVILGGGLAGALLSFLAVVALTPAKKEVWEDELPTNGSFGHDPLHALRPRMNGMSTASATAGGQALLSLVDRRFRFRASSSPPEEP